MSYQVIQNRQLLPLQWQLHAYYPLASCVCPKGIGTQMNVISLKFIIVVQYCTNQIIGDGSGDQCIWSINE